MGPGEPSAPRNAERAEWAERAERADEYGADHDALVMIGAGTQIIAVSGIAWGAAA